MGTIQLRDKYAGIQYCNSTWFTLKKEVNLNVKRVRR